MLARMRNKLMTAAVGLMFAAAPVAAQSPADAADGEWVTLSGTVETVSGEDFVLDYGKSSITVEMDDYDWYDENQLQLGDEVVVTGRVDDDFLQSRRLEASTVYVDSIHTRFYASAEDEEDFRPAADGAIVGSDRVVVTGTVESIDGEVIRVDAGVLDYIIDTGSLYYDPFDTEGLQKIDVGDRVQVSGSFDDSDFFDNPEIDATALTEISA